MGKIAFVTTLQPDTHYCRYLLNELEKLEDLEIWADKDEKKAPVKTGAFLFLLKKLAISRAY